MSQVCEHLQAVLVEHGPAALRGNAAAQEHLIACADCFAFLEALAQVDELLATPPVHDAPAALVDRLLAQLAAPTSTPTSMSSAAAPAVTPTSATSRSSGAPSRWRAVWLVASRQVAGLRRLFARLRLERLLRPVVLAPAGGALLLLFAVGTVGLMLAPGRPLLADLDEMSHFAKLPAASSSVDAPEDGEPPPAPKRGRARLGRGSGRLSSSALAAGDEVAESSSEQDDNEIDTGRLISQTLGVAPRFAGGKADEPAKPGPPPPPVVTGAEQLASRLGEGARRDQARIVEREERSEADAARPQAMGALAKEQIAARIQAAGPELQRALDTALQSDPAVAGKVVVDFVIGADGRVADARINSSTTKNAELERNAVEIFRRLSFPAPRGGGTVKVSYPLTFRASDGTAGEPAADSPARLFLAEREQIEGLSFKDATGYWANTYVPGDPAMRLLAAQLEQTAAAATRLDGAARQNRQPFDAPSHAALAVYLDADRAGLDGPARMLVQVGIQATARRSRARPAMNLGIVLDLRQAPSADQATAMRALIGALVKRRDTGDRFTLVVAGRPGGVIVSAERFAHGPVLVALQQLFGERSPADGATLDLVSAMETAYGQVVVADDPHTPLGSSMVLLISAGRFDGDLATLTMMAHDGAVNGVPASVVGVGSTVSLSELDQLVLAGQGNRRLLGAALEAEALIDRELTAQSRVVARAVRLRLRLAPGVKLVDVLGSYRLDEARAEEVRQAEQSIDRRLSRNLGLASDRGDDEEGIQIVIPAFYAGDAHTLLLDVVASGPGPIADVRLRFKDLVALRNGVARANLTLPRRQLTAGPLQLNVTKNLLARRLSAALADSSAALSAGELDEARRVIVESLELLTDLGRLLPGLGSDRDLAQDRALLVGYHQALGGGGADAGLADSLRLASFFKLSPRPPEP